MSFEIHISLPDKSPAVEVVRSLAAKRRITEEQAATQLLIEGASQRGAISLEESIDPPDLQEKGDALDAAITTARSLHPTYSSFFGAVSGPGAHGSPEAADRYIRELRDAW